MRFELLLSCYIWNFHHQVYSVYCTVVTLQWHVVTDNP
jgi:hypothetical protein